MALSRQSKTKALWSGAVTVALLAIVIMVFAAFGSLGADKGATPPVPVITPATESRSLYEQALQAQQSGDTTRAAELARQAVTADPSNTQAKTLLDDVTKPSSNPPDTGSDTTKTPKPTAASDKLFLKRYPRLSVLLPKVFTGFDVGPPAQLGRDVSMSGSPTGQGSVSAIIWSVHDRKSAAGAKRFVATTSKSAFPKDAASVVVDGIRGYFGTDGTQVASVSFARGRYAFEALITADRVKPVTTKAVALKAAQAFPDTPSK